MSENISTPLITEAAEIKNEIQAALAACFPGLVEAGGDLLERVSTPNWVLEWGMPRWLGEMFNLPGEINQELLLSNV